MNKWIISMLSLTEPWAWPAEPPHLSRYCWPSWRPWRVCGRLAARLLPAFPSQLLWMPLCPAAAPCPFRRCGQRCFCTCGLAQQSWFGPRMVGPLTCYEPPWKWELSAPQVPHWYSAESETFAKVLCCCLSEKNRETKAVSTTEDNTRGEEEV